MINGKTRGVPLNIFSSVVTVWLCVCTGDNPSAKTLGLSHCTYVQNVQQLSLYCDFATFPLIYAVPDFRKDHIFSKGGDIQIQNTR